MQAELAYYNKIEIEEEDFLVTFQIALVGLDGIVLASDSRVTYVTPATRESPEPMQQHSSESKFIASPNKKIVCVYAGGPQAEPTARAVAIGIESSDHSSEVGWRDALGRLADSVKRGSSGSNLMDEVLVCRANTLGCFWHLSKMKDNPANIRPVTTFSCAGDASPARFIPACLFRPKMPVYDLKKLALLTLAYASRHNPSAVNEPFEILVVRASDVEAIESFTMSKTQGLMGEFERHFCDLFERLDYPS